MSADVTPSTCRDGDAQQDGSNLADTLLAEYVAANANLRRERQKLEKDLAAVRQAHEDLLFERQDHMESCDEDNVLRMKLELHKNQVIFIESYLPLAMFHSRISAAPKSRAEFWYFQHAAN